MPSWRGRWRAAGYKQYSLSIASAAAGALLGAGVQNLANSNLRVMSTIAVVLCLGLVAVYASLTARDREIAMANQALREKTAQDASSIISKIRQLEKQVGVEIRYQLVAEIDHTASWKEEILGQQVEIAKTEILVLDLLSATGRRPDTHQDYRLESYYSNLIQKAANGVLYHRVLQVEDPTMPTPCLPDTPFRKHCQEVCRVRKEKRNWNASIRVARRRYPYRFLIIDRKVVAVQLSHSESNVVDEQLDYCNLVISDPGGDLVKVFLNMWSDAVEAQDTRLLTSEELDIGGQNKIVNTS